MASPQTKISRRNILLGLGGVGLGSLMSPASFADDGKTKPNTKKLDPIFESVVCPWTPENPRHDHQLIFPLDDGRLILAWCEYYVRSPSGITRQPTTKKGQAGDEMPCRISARVSTDKGRSWSGRIVLQESLWKRNVKHPNLVRLPSGEILFSFVGWDSEGQRNVFMKRSADECETWSETVQISEPGWYCNNNDHALTLTTGRVVLPAHGIIGGGPYRGGKSKLESFVYYSDDGFKTWKRSADSMTAPGRGCHEPTIAELEDGRLLCLMRTNTGRIYQSHSSDQGDHWSEPEATDLPAPESPPLVKRIPKTGDLLLLWNHVESRGNWPRTPLTAAISRDQGRTWTHFNDVDNRTGHDAAYASLHFQDDEALVAYYTRPTHWARDSEVTLKIFKIDQLYA